MKKAEQMKINKEVIAIFEAAIDEMKKPRINRTERLYNCQAHTEDIGNYIVLTSYNTEIAVYSKLTGIVYDFLRYVYGYTAASAQHISKFARKYHASEVIRYYPV